MAAPILKPEPQQTERKLIATGIRSTAANLRAHIPVPEIENNGELTAYWPQIPATFTKGLTHNAYGIPNNEGALRSFIAFINQGDALARGFGFPDRVGHGLKDSSRERHWESPLAGHVYDLEGPDAGELTIPPAPKLDSNELAAEMAEVYALALLRDKTFEVIETNGDDETEEINELVAEMPWFGETGGTAREKKRRKARSKPKSALKTENLYRGSTVGAKIGPYISQFLLIGNAARGKNEKNDTPDAALSKSDATNGAYTAPAIAIGDIGHRKARDGFIVYGAQEINQKVRAHKQFSDYMADWNSWLAIQNGKKPKLDDAFEMKGRFIATPRDLATYVHYDQLYQAYLNACLIMLSFDFPRDPGLPENKGSSEETNVNRFGFATFGGPHVLSLMTEVASRALKHARRQKFNTHLRARPEAIAAMITLAANAPGKQRLGGSFEATKKALNAVDATGLLKKVAAHNNNVAKGPEGGNPSWLKNNYLLPMAFPEGSPMHPSYAAGHASVAGACVTVLKAFFKMFDKSGDVSKSWDPTPFLSLYGSTETKQIDALGLSKAKSASAEDKFVSGIFEAAADAQTLKQVSKSRAKGISIIGELDKLAANISIGRDMAGVHYYTDYYESLRMGERVAVGILQEQMLTYREPVSMSLQTFDGENMTITGKGDGLTVDIAVAGTTFEDWFTRID